MPLEKLAIIREFCFILIASLFKKIIIVHLRGGKYNLKKNIPKYLRFLTKLSFKKAHKIIVLGEKELAFFSYEYCIDVSKILVLPNSVKINKLNKSMIKYDKDNSLNILFFGRLDKNKGLKEIIQSLSNLKINFMLKIAGDGFDKNWFLNQCESELKNKYEYLDVVSGDIKNKLLINSDVFILPSYYEGLPNALLEAMSYGIVPIVTPVGSIPDIITNNSNGIIVPVKNSISIGASLKRLYDDKIFYDKLSTNAFRTIKNNYCLDS